MSEPIQNCPVCGESAHSKRTVEGKRRYFVSGRLECLMGPALHTEAEAIAVWNQICDWKKAYETQGKLVDALKDAEPLVIGWACHHAMQGKTTNQELSAATEVSGWHPTHRAIYEKVQAALREAGVKL